MSKSFLSAINASGVNISASTLSVGSTTSASGNITTTASFIGAGASVSGDAYIGSTLTFANPGVGNTTKFVFTKTNDGAELRVLERAADQTYYEFFMRDNPDSSDYFQWTFDDWQNPATGWMPLQIGQYTSRYIAATHTFWGNMQSSTNSPFYTTNNATSASGGTDVGVLKYSPYTSTSYNLWKDAGTGTGNLNVDVTAYTATSRTMYWVTIDGSNTFKWGTGANSGTPTASLVAITGGWQTLSNGVSIKLPSGSATYSVNDRWSFIAFPVTKLSIGGTPAPNAMATIYPSASMVGLVIRGAASQSSNLQQWQDSTPTTLAFVDNAGGIYAPAFGPVNQTGGYISTANSSPVRIITNASATQALVVRGAASQTADLTQWQNSASTTLSTINSSGQIAIGASAAIQNSSSVNAMLSVVPSSSTNPGIMIRGVASQSGNLLELQNSSSTQVAYITPAGSLISAGRLIATAAGDTGARLVLGTSASTMIGLTVQGAASQSANLQEWQDSSSVVQAYMTGAGVLRASIVQCSSANVDLRTANSGGQITVFRQTASATAPGTNYSRLYTRDGTTSGTIKLVSVSGSAGTEVTLFDNLDSIGTTAPLQVGGSAGITYYQTTNSQSGSAYTLALSDIGKFIEMTSSAANTITVPAASAVAWTVGTRIDVIQYGAGTTTISPAAGVTVNYYSPTSAATRTIKARYGAATLVYRASNEWLLIGNLT